jgi:mRNA-degrading endonuclease RelE of RelBE toxin-antitoxin system
MNTILIAPEVTQQIKSLNRRSRSRILAALESMESVDIAKSHPQCERLSRDGLYACQADGYRVFFLLDSHARKYNAGQQPILAVLDVVSEANIRKFLRREETEPLLPQKHVKLIEQESVIRAVLLKDRPDQKADKVSIFRELEQKLKDLDAKTRDVLVQRFRELENSKPLRDAYLDGRLEKLSREGLYSYRVSPGYWLFLSLNPLGDSSLEINLLELASTQEILNATRGNALSRFLFLIQTAIVEVQDVVDALTVCSIKSFFFRLLGFKEKEKQAKAKVMRRRKTRHEQLEAKKRQAFAEQSPWKFMDNYSKK